MVVSYECSAILSANLCYFESQLIEPSPFTFLKGGFVSVDVFLMKISRIIKNSHRFLSDYKSLHIQA
jgi:hypothetical protein